MSIEKDVKKLIQDKSEEFQYSFAAHRARIYNVQSILEASRSKLSTSKVGSPLAYIHQHRENIEEFIHWQKAFMLSDYKDEFVKFEQLRVSVEELLELSEKNEEVSKLSILETPEFMTVFAVITCILMFYFLFIYNNSLIK